MTSAEPASRRRRKAERRGKRGEGFAAWLLRLKGYRILARRARTPLGEIDIIARRGGSPPLSRSRPGTRATMRWRP